MTGKKLSGTKTAKKVNFVKSLTLLTKSRRECYQLGTNLDVTTFARVGRRGRGAARGIQGPLEGAATRLRKPCERVSFLAAGRTGRELGRGSRRHGSPDSDRRTACGGAL